MTTAGQELIKSAKEALAFARDYRSIMEQLGHDLGKKTLQIYDKKRHQEALLFSRSLGECFIIPVTYNNPSINTDENCPVIPVHDMGDLE
jgi:hypothetical protein